MFLLPGPRMTVTPLTSRWFPVGLNVCGPWTRGECFSLTMDRYGSRNARFRPGRNGGRLAAMPVTASFGRKQTYRAYGLNGEQLASEDLGSDDEALAWVRQLVKNGLSVGRLSREITAGFGMDVPLP